MSGSARPGGPASEPARFESDGSAAAAYRDRNLTAQAFALAALDLGLRAGVRDRDAAWPVVFIDLPSGQVSWHVPRAELDPRLPDYEGAWDGHDVETKLARLRGVRA